MWNITGAKGKIEINETGEVDFDLYVTLWGHFF